MTRRHVVDTSAHARRMRETFTAKPLGRGEHDLGHRWPTEVQHVGHGAGADEGSIMYTSDKWKKDLDFEDYKHVAEAAQDFFFTREILLEGANLVRHGPWCDFGGALPSHVAELAPILGIEVRMFVGEDRKGDGILGRRDEGYVQIVIPHAVLYGAHKPDTKEPFLLIATREHGVLVVVTGHELDVTADGIVG